MSTLLALLVLLAVVVSTSHARRRRYQSKHGKTFSQRHLASAGAQDPYSEEDGRKFMVQLNEEGSTWQNRLSNAEWDYNADLTDQNLQKHLKLQSEYAAYFKEQWKEVIKYPWKTFEDASLKRQFKFFSQLGKAALPEEKLKRLDEVIAKMSDIYGTTKLLKWQGHGKKRKSSQLSVHPTISLEPDLTLFFSGHTQDSCELLYYWEGWHGSVGRKEKALFEEYVELSNEAAILNNYTDNSVVWNENFEMDDFDDAIHKLYLQILPFYQQLHAYIRRRLAKHHNSKHHKLIDEHGSLPAHLLGNMWAQTWSNIYDLTAPYPKKVSVDVTPTMLAKNFTVLELFKMSEEFYTSLNLSAMTKTFWEKSILEKPTDREMVCHASAWDFSNGEDYRIKMCTRINLEDFKTIHHEMGHIQYYMQYKDQPYVFRDGANTGFHEAIGDTIALSVSTAEHLMKVGLLDPHNYKEDKETEINSLYMMALDKVPFLPFAYVLDLWRWEIFRGDVTPETYNCRYWQLRQELQGIVPPVDRSAKEFDAGAKYHVIADVSYIRYFVSFIIQFQFHKALCTKAGQYDPDDPASKPLHHCDIYQSTEAGNLFGKMLQMGKSKPPQEAMEVLTGQRDMDAGPLLEYFKPLHDWLIHENRRAGVTVGWSAADKRVECHNGRVKTPRGAGSEDRKCRYFHSQRKGTKRRHKESAKGPGSQGQQTSKKLNAKIRS